MEKRKATKIPIHQKPQQSQKLHHNYMNTTMNRQATSSSSFSLLLLQPAPAPSSEIAGAAIIYKRPCKYYSIDQNNHTSMYKTLLSFLIREFKLCPSWALPFFWIKPSATDHDPLLELQKRKEEGEEKTTTTQVSKSSSSRRWWGALRTGG